MKTLQQVLHMNKGFGDASYANNSTVQENIISMGQPILAEAVLKLIQSVHCESLGLADLGCSSGPNSLKAVSEIANMIFSNHYSCRLQNLELRIYLNDLPCNDFNSIFSDLLPEFYNKFENRSVFLSAVPGSFYGRLFPSSSLHFIHSSSSLHWLSQAPKGLETKDGNPLNKCKIYISKTSPASVLNTYLAQFQADFTMFLESRAEELVPGGCMVLSFMGRTSPDPTATEAVTHWELLAKTLMSMVYDGLIDEEKVDTFNAPYYAPSSEEIQLLIKNEGSFVTSRIETLDVYWDKTNYLPSSSTSSMFNQQAVTLDQSEKLAMGQQVAKAHRAVAESMFRSHFGIGDKVMDELFRRHGEIVGGHLLKYETKYINLVISLTRKGRTTD
ncbi:unnamed protein product [Rhodiola kirilowii]